MTKEDIWFKKDLLDVFKGFELLMAKRTAEFRGAQTLALKVRFYSWKLNELELLLYVSRLK